MSPSFSPCRCALSHTHTHTHTHITTAILWGKKRKISFWRDASNRRPFTKSSRIVTEKKILKSLEELWYGNHTISHRYILMLLRYFEERRNKIFCRLGWAAWFLPHFCRSIYIYIHISATVKRRYQILKLHQNTHYHCHYCEYYWFSANTCLMFAKNNMNQVTMFFVGCFPVWLSCERPIDFGSPWYTLHWSNLEVNRLCETDNLSRTTLT